MLEVGKLAAIIVLLYLIAYVFIIFKPDVSPVTTLICGALASVLAGHSGYAGLSHIVDFNTVAILLGMMLIVSVLKDHGIFTYAAARVLTISRGDPFKVVLLVNVAIFLLSAFLDNVTTILIFIPILLYISDVAGLDPKMLVANAIFFSNIGGMTTAIGDPPNIVIFSSSKLSFVAFIKTLMPVGVLVMALQLFLLSRKLDRTVTLNEGETEKVESTKAFWYVLVFAAVIFLMAYHEHVGLEMGTVALLGALVLLLLEGKTIQNQSHEVDWDTLTLVIGLYLLDAALEKINFTASLVGWFRAFVGTPFLKLLVFWSSLLAAGFLSALPVTMIFLAIIKKLIALGATRTLYWALALGVGIGGSLTPVGSMCNIVGNNVLKKYKNERLKFWEFTSFSLEPVLMGGVISSLFLLLIR